MSTAPHHPAPGTAPTCGCGCGGHDESRAPAALYNPPGRTALALRTGTHGTFLAAMLDRLASPAYPALRGLTARTTDDPAVALLDAWAILGDLLTFHSERIADEGYLRTADEHRSLAMLARLVGHRPRPGVAASTHLDLADGPRLRHVDEILAHLDRARDRYGAPVILAGDVNEEPGGRSWSLLTGHFQDAHAVAPAGGEFTFSARDPRRRIDAVFTDPEVRITACGVPDDDAGDHVRATDHRPLAADLTVP